MDPSTYSYWNSIFQSNHNAPVESDGYSTDLISNYALNFIEEAYTSDRPFFIGVAPIAPHAKVVAAEGSSAFTFPDPAERHQENFAYVKSPQEGGNFNPDTV
jgi:arylsulfatase